MAEGKIYGALLGVMDDIGAIGKDKRNTQQGFNYRGVDDVMNVLHPLLVKHGVLTVPTVMEHTREQRTTGKGNTILYSIVKLRVDLIAEDGSSVSATVIGEGMDSGDKATNKAMSVAYKYAMFQLLCIPTEEMKDPDAENPLHGDTLEPVQPKRVPPPAPPAPVCVLCHKAIGGIKGKDGSAKAPEDVAAFTQEQTGAALCWTCYKTWREENRA